MAVEISKVYEPRSVEEKWYEFWLKNKLFSCKVEKGKKPFTIVIPPPNVTGSLHMGHALNNTLQDIIIRYQKMRGFNTLWVPGTDHGGIATQNVVEKLLLSQGTNRQDMGREKFVERMWQWRRESGDTILNQLKKLGCSLDWDRTRFTMDEVCSRAVVFAFVNLYNRGLIYRGKRLVNWCPHCQTALSDIEVEHEEEIGKLWHIKYPLAENGKQPKSAKKSKKSGEYVIVATTRPETMLGDTAVAVHPDDKRYKKIIGGKIRLPLTDREIPVVADEAVDPTFGTGAVKVTPAHDPVDFDIAARQKLPHIVVIDYQGKMTPKAGDSYAGLDRYEARKKVLHDLETQGLLLETADHPHSIGHCYRCNSVIEPLVSEQWFLKVEEMSRKAMQVVEEGKVKFYPESWKKPYLLWLENLRDWCISRQIWWGHRIPVYYCVSKSSKSGKDKPIKSNCPPIVAHEMPKKCPKCKGTNIVQDPDVLDTWFSSALWPFSVFGWPKKEEEFSSSDLEYFYPTNVLVTGHEILYLWVARMIQMGLEFMGDVPYSDVFIHGMVRDKFGKKMSKSLGNVIDPLEVMGKYGADALRFSLTQSAAPGRDMQLAEDSFVGARNFTNKLWNASRFVFMHLQNVTWQPGFMAVWPLDLCDMWILAEYRLLVNKVTDAMNKYNIDEAARLIYDFFWSKYCDWYIELAKIRLMGSNERNKKTAVSMLIEILSGVLRLLHPIMPFITEEIWSILIELTGLKSPDQLVTIMTSSWPVAEKEKASSKDVEDMNLLQNIIISVRTIRSEMRVPPGKKINMVMNIISPRQMKIVADHLDYIKALAGVENILTGQRLKRPAQSAVSVVSEIEIFVPLAGLIDIEKEKQRLVKEIQSTEVEVERCNKNLSNQSFVQKAPKKEVERMKNRLIEAKVKKERLQESVKSLE
ncbi:MAG: valine--tRNA ligase [Endomicrobiales bacterium]|nr:valine--tRNA ligase [Endomicrobiales bacterium]